MPKKHRLKKLATIQNRWNRASKKRIGYVALANRIKPGYLALAHLKKKLKSQK